MPESSKKDISNSSGDKQTKTRLIKSSSTTTEKQPKLKIFLPAIIVGGLIFIYGIFNVFFIQCPQGLCNAVDGALISAIDKNKTFDLSTAATDIDCKLETLSAAESTLLNRRSLQKATEDNLASTASRIDAENIELFKITGELPADPETEIVGELGENEIITPPKSEDSSDPIVNEQKKKIKQLAQTQLKQQSELKRRETEANKALINRDTAESQVVAARTSISSRYISRVLWIFFSGLYLVLFIATIWFTVSVMTGALKDLPKIPFLSNPSTWHVLTFLFAVGLGIAIWCGEESVMSIVGPIYQASIFDTNEIPKRMVIFFNAIAFAVIVYLAAASCSMIYTVTKGNDSDEWRDKSKILLFLSGALLFVGLLRIDIISKWHLVFVSDAYRPLLESFFTNSLTIQAFFYTIIVAVIYLPLSYSFTSTKADPSVKELISAKGIWETVKTFAPRFILLVSPLLAKPIADLLKFLLNGQAE